MIDTRHYSAPDELKDGTPMKSSQPSRAGDRDAIATAFAELDRNFVYTRFFSYGKQLTGDGTRQSTDVDFEHVVALVVVECGADGEELLGGGRYCSSRRRPRSTARNWPL